MSGPVVSTSRRRALPSIMAWANRLTSFVPPPPAAEDDAKDRVVVVQVHPNGRGPSFTLALGEAVRDSLKAAGVFAQTHRRQGVGIRFSRSRQGCAV